MFHAHANAQGWTKFTNFDDLYAMDESEWDKVCLLLCSMNEPI
jgi:hypothetical protein